MFALARVCHEGRSVGGVIQHSRVRCVLIPGCASWRPFPMRLRAAHGLCCIRVRAMLCGLLFVAAPLALGWLQPEGWSTCVFIM